jgi:serine/threonine protein kinase
VKVIDFGIAKATEARLTERTLSIDFRQLIGTPAYMSPEQAETIGSEADTRSDIYSLGVLLYELLTGTTPLDATGLTGKSFDELRRTIREVEPPPPSLQVALLGGDALSRARRRNTDAKQLRRLLHGELDWITMRCLEKDRARRYATANDLAADVLRYLRYEPVEAGPPSATYRLGKLARKHRAKLLTVASFVLLLIVATVVSIRAAIRANEARFEAQRETERQIAINVFLHDIIARGL